MYVLNSVPPMQQRLETSAPAHYITIRHGDMMPRHFFQDEG
jgi:hypothetical protein